MQLILFISIYTLNKAIPEDGGIAEKCKEDIFLVIQSTSPGVCPIFRLPVGENHKCTYGLLLLDLDFSNSSLKTS